MIYSVTLNPSIDFIVRVENFEEGKTNRAFADEFYAGGKGIMVSKLLKNIGTDCINLGFIGGFTGKFIENNLNTLNIKSQFTEVEENTRINIKLKSKEETEINCKGPIISQEAIDKFLEKIKTIKNTDFVILSGSVPAALRNDFYITIIEILNKNGVNFTLDSSGEAFKKSLEYKPFLIKPNKDEISEFAGKKLSTNNEIIEFARKNLLDKAYHVIVSMGGDGALYIAKDYAFFAPALKGEVVNSVGAGDSVVAGFVDSILKEKTVEESFKFAVACGTATAFSEDIGKLNFIEEIKNKLNIERV